MPAYQVCQNFFRDALAPFHNYRQKALLDATIALINGASLTLTSIGRYLSGTAQVKNKIKRVDRLLGNESLHHDIPLIFSNIISMLTGRLSLCVIAVDWSGYPSQCARFSRVLILKKLQCLRDFFQHGFRLHTDDIMFDLTVLHFRHFLLALNPFLLCNYFHFHIQACLPNRTRPYILPIHIVDRFYLILSMGYQNRLPFVYRNWLLYFRHPSIY